MIDDISTREWAAWREVCALLLKMKAVTGVDLDAPVRSPPKTPGEELLNAIRTWGKLNVKLHLVGKVDAS